MTLLCYENEKINSRQAWKCIQYQLYSAIYSVQEFCCIVIHCDENYFYKNT